jgi:excisionase family DNA binding protein
MIGTGRTVGRETDACCYVPIPARVREDDRMPEEEGDPLVTRTPVSPWLLGVLPLGWLVVLAVTLHDVGLVLAAWFVSMGLVLLVVTARRRPGAATPGPLPAGDPSPPPRDFPLVLTDEEAAGLLRVRPDEIVEAIRGSEFPGNRIGGHWRVRTDSLFTWLEGPYAAARLPPEDEAG